MEYININDFENEPIIKPKLNDKYFESIGNNINEENTKNKIINDLKQFVNQQYINIKEKIIKEGIDFKIAYSKKINNELNEYYIKLKREKDDIFNDKELKQRKCIDTEIKDLKNEKSKLNNEVNKLKQEYNDYNNKNINLKKYLEEELKKYISTLDFKDKLEEEYNKKEKELKIIYDEQLIIINNKLNEIYKDREEEIKRINNDLNELIINYNYYIQENTFYNELIQKNKEEIEKHDERLELLNKTYEDKKDFLKNEYNEKINDKKNIQLEIKSLNNQFKEDKQKIKEHEQIITSKDKLINKLTLDIKNLEERYKDTIQTIKESKKELDIIKNDINKETKRLSIIQSKNETYKNEIIKQKELINSNDEYINNNNKQLEDINNGIDELNKNKNRTLNEIHELNNIIENKKDEIDKLNDIFNNLKEEYNIKRDETLNLKIIKVLDNKSKKILVNEENKQKTNDIYNKSNEEDDYNDNDILNFSKISTSNIKKVKDNEIKTETDKYTDNNTVENNKAIESLNEFNDKNNNEILEKYIKLALNNRDVGIIPYNKEVYLRKIFNIGSFKKISDTLLGTTKQNKTFERKYVYAYLNEVYEKKYN